MRQAPQILHPKEPNCSVSARDGGAQLASVISKRDSIAREKVPEMGLGAYTLGFRTWSGSWSFKI